MRFVDAKCAFFFLKSLSAGSFFFFFFDPDNFSVLDDTWPRSPSLLFPKLFEFEFIQVNLGLDRLFGWMMIENNQVSLGRFRSVTDNLTNNGYFIEIQFPFTRSFRSVHGPSSGLPRVLGVLIARKRNLPGGARSINQTSGRVRIGVRGLFVSGP